MIPRYSLPEMSALWTDEEKFRRWLLLEVYACEAWARQGKVPKAALEVIRQKAVVDVPRIQALELEVKHDVIAFLTSVTEKVGADGRYIHMGLTSSDVIDTVLATQLVDALDGITVRVAALLKVLKKRAPQYRDTLMIGRSHGMHAEPTTFGLKLALWYSIFSRHLERLGQLRPRMAVGKLSGAVGTYAHLPPVVEKYVLGKLKLTPAPVATQVVQRDRHAEYFSTLALVAASIEQVAVEIRHLQRTEVREVEEDFTRGQKGSSAMPHKRNPILSENLTGGARLMRGYAQASMENVALWHERDISHSSVERVIAPDATILLDFMLHRLTGLVDRLHVHPQRMLHNLDATRGLIYSQELLLALVEAGCTREDAYARVQRHATSAWEGAEDFRDLVRADPVVREKVGAERLQALFDPKRQLTHVQTIFDRVFGEAPVPKERV